MSHQLPRTFVSRPHPLQTWLLVLAVASGVPLAAGYAEQASIAAALPDSYVMTWGLFLTVSSAAALVGTYWRGELDTAVVLERAGLLVVGWAAVAYAAVVVIDRTALAVLSDAHATREVVITATFGWACLVRARHLTEAIDLAKATRDTR